MNRQKDIRQIIETTGEKYNEIIFHDDYIPKSVYLYQIGVRNEFITKSLENKKFDYILDLGCGTGFHLHTLSHYTNNLIGIDMSFGALQACRKCGNDFFADFIVCDINHLPFKEKSINCIWIAGVLHHVPEDLECIFSENLVSIMKDNGYLLIDEPNILNFFNFINMKLSKADPTGEERPLSFGYVENLLKHNNFEILKSEYYGFFSPVGVLLNSPFMFKILHSLDLILQRSCTRFILLRWNVCAKKREDPH